MFADKDGLVCRCRRLGGEVSFKYCRSSEKNLQPCRQIFNCWWETFDVVSYLKKRLPPEALESIMEPPKPKITSILDILTDIQQRKKNEIDD